MSTLTAVQKQQAERRVTLRNFFEQQKPELSKLLPKNMSLDRLFRMALTECVKNPDLLNCTAESWALAMQVCAAQGLYPDSGLGYMYLIPRKNKNKGTVECTAMRGYQGDIALVRKSGELLDIYAEVVYEKDTYRVRKGLDRTIEHEPYAGDEEPGALRATYAVAKLRGGEVAWVALTRRDVERHKKSAQGLDRTDSPWRVHEDQMWKKTAIRELVRWLPKATEEMERVGRDEEAERHAAAAIDISAREIPVGAEPKSSLDQLTEQLNGGAVSQPTGQCSHPDITPAKLTALAPGKTLVCTACGEEISAPVVVMDTRHQDDLAAARGQRTIEE